MSLLPTVSAQANTAPSGTLPAGGVPDTNPTTED